MKYLSIDRNSRICSFCVVSDCIFLDLSFQTNGEQQCMALVDYMENHKSGSFYNVEIVPDFAGIQRFVTGFCRK